MGAARRRRKKQERGEAYAQWLADVAHDMDPTLDPALLLEVARESADRSAFQWAARFHARQTAIWGSA